ncbi:NAD-dependent epimerase/dehydratase family protein [Sphingobium sufflavum]|uniref:NAD-dependent epimerase/dehydratase family protein n=1 Tax=Sphingobium sufflavum TaxID=1129547 RepID=UPI001F2C947E|nr:NAD-dependent epimerase/dehydratase family protein [Sphingobium sufflavum]MCE7795554.1 NAD-dependent epimerase/dehydratase family protein [Sphingobium sufflavum]
MKKLIFSSSIAAYGEPGAGLIDENALTIIQNYDRILRGERPHLSGDGSEVHDYIHVADVARANVMAMASD